MCDGDKHDTESRIDSLLDQLDDPAITRDQIEMIEKKVKILRSVQQ